LSRRRNKLNKPKQELPGISGAKLTLVVLTGILVLGLGIAYTLATYIRLNQARDDTDRRWREVASLLDQDYQQLLVDGSDTNQTDSQIVGDSLLAAVVDRFRTSVDAQQQRLLADQVESTIAQRPTSSDPAPKASTELLKVIDDYNQGLEVERQILGSPGGRILRVILVLRDRVNFQVSR
jgi:hypothetical protein